MASRSRAVNTKVTPTSSMHAKFQIISLVLPSPFTTLIHEQYFLPEDLQNPFLYSCVSPARLGVSFLMLDDVCCVHFSTGNKRPAWEQEG